MRGSAHGGQGHCAIGCGTARLRRFFLKGQKRPRPFGTKSRRASFEGGSAGFGRKGKNPIADQAFAIGDGPRGQAWTGHPRSGSEATRAPVTVPRLDSRFYLFFEPLRIGHMSPIRPILKRKKCHVQGMAASGGGRLQRRPSSVTVDGTPPGFKGSAVVDG